MASPKSRSSKISGHPVHGDSNVAGTEFRIPAAGETSLRLLTLVSGPRAGYRLTHLSEAAAGFPARIHPSWHYGLVRCVNCLCLCPNRNSVMTTCDDGDEFTEYEAAPRIPWSGDAIAGIVDTHVCD